MNSLRLCGGSAATTAMLAMKRTFMGRSLSSASSTVSELLEPGLVPRHQWRSVTGQAATDTPNIQWGAVGRKP